MTEKELQYETIRRINVFWGWVTSTNISSYGRLFMVEGLFLALKQKTLGRIVAPKKYLKMYLDLTEKQIKKAREELKRVGVLDYYIDKDTSITTYFFHHDVMEREPWVDLDWCSENAWWNVRDASDSPTVPNEYKKLHSIKTTEVYKPTNNGAYL